MEAIVTTTVLVTGPTGKVGRRLIPLLARRGATVRAASRSPVAARAGVEPVRFDWTDESTYDAARKGVDAMYLVPARSRNRHTRTISAHYSTARPARAWNGSCC
jgi:uncharacterized protein YbjT (DUF2867 family)